MLPTRALAPLLGLMLAASACELTLEPDMTTDQVSPPVVSTTVLAPSTTVEVLPSSPTAINEPTISDSGAAVEAPETDATAPSIPPATGDAVESDDTIQPDDVMGSGDTQPAVPPAAQPIEPEAATPETNDGSVASQPADPPLGILDFETFEPGQLTEAQFRTYLGELGEAAWSQLGGLVSIEQEDANRFLRMSFPQGEVNDRNASASVGLRLSDLNDGCASFRVRLPEGFDAIPNAMPSLDPSDQPGAFGEELALAQDFPTGRWVSMRTCFMMNTPGAFDGEIQSWMDGTLVLDKRDIRFNDTADFVVDPFLFETFFGGSSPDGAPSMDEYIDLDDLSID